MKHDVMRQAAEYRKKRHRENQWRKLVICLAMIVAFCTNYVMTYPAVTMENRCPIPEHTHGEECYARLSAAPRRRPACTAERLNIHQHTKACKNSDGAYVCGYADFVVHEHDESCYEEGNLWCPLPKIKPHTHSKGCYASVDASAVHQHSDDCYAQVQGALICGEEEREGHTHSEADCYTTTSTLVCQIPESAGHQHGDACFDEEGNGICGLSEGEGAHAHGEGCYEETRALSCTIPEDAGHHHSDDCYEKAQGELLCTESTEPPAPELVCGKEEIILHEHQPSCYDKNGWLICGKRQVLEHRHSDECFVIVEGLEETPTLVCELEEHIHSDACQVLKPEEDTQENPEGEKQDESDEGVKTEPEDGTQTEPEDGTQTEPEDGTQTEPEDGTQTDPEDGTQTEPEDGTQTEPEDGTQTEPEGGTQTEPEDGMQTEPEGGTQTEPEDGTQTEPEDGTQAEPEGGTQTEPENGTQTEPEDGTQTEPEDGAQTVPEDGTQTEPGDGTQIEPEDGTQTEPEDGTQTEPEDGTQTEPEDGAQVEPEDGAQTGPEDGTQTKPEDGMQSDPEDGTQTEPGDGTQTEPEDGMQTEPEDGTQTEPEDGTQTEPEDGTQTEPEDGTQTEPEDGTQTEPEDGTQTEPEDGTQTEPEDGTQTEPEDGMQTEPEDGMQTEPEDGTQTEPEDGAQTEPEDGTQTEPEDGAQTEPEDGTQTEPEDGAQTGPEDGTQTEPEDGAQTGPEDGTQTEPEDGTQTEPEEGTQTEPEDGTQTEPEDGAQTGPEDGTQTELEDGTQVEPEDGAGDETISSGLTIPADWPVQGTAYAYAGPMMMAAVQANDLEINEVIPRTAPLDMKEYVQSASLSYRANPGESWQSLTPSTIIPGTADLRLDIQYDRVNIDQLLAAGGKITYTLPEIMRNPQVKGKITSGNTDVGTITVSGKAVTLTFDPQWLKDQKTETNSVIHGEFYVESKIDLTEIPQSGETQLIVGDVTIGVNFGEDVIARSAKIDLTKSNAVFSSDATGDYLTYTLTVTAGEDGAPDVKVADAFTEHSEWIDSYMGVTSTETSTSGNTDPSLGPVETGNNGTVKLEGNGGMTWAIGNMAPNETRTLTYKVRLKDDYTNYGHTETITNTARAFSKDHPRDPVASHFTPKAAAAISKQSANFVPDENGGGTITYTVWVQADSLNTYTLDNVKIVDALDGSIQNWHATDAEFRHYLSYDGSSFHLYEGGDKEQNGTTGLTIIPNAASPAIEDTDGDGNYNDRFSYEVGSLKPGESRTLTYTVKVGPGAFAKAGNSDIPIHNRAMVCLKDENKSLYVYDHTKTVNKKVWARKLHGERQAAQSPITMDGSVYDATGGTVVPAENPGSFIVPEGCYQYQIAANEAGDWDISSASMTDALEGRYMQFVGYVQVDAYVIDGNVPGSDLTDAAAIANLSARKPAKTVWVKADGKQSFAFKPNDIGLGGNKYAYRLTYYAQPVHVDGVTQVVVRNTFTLEGEVGNFVLTGVKVNASVTVEGTNSFSAEKLGWYFEDHEGGKASFERGDLYWVIKVDGNIIPAGTHLKDTTIANSGETAHYIRNNSLVGVYTGNLEGKSVTDYDDMDALRRSGKLTALEEDCYSLNVESDKNMTVQLLQDVNLGNENSLYVILKTEPYYVPSGIRETRTFGNTLSSSFDGENWVDYPRATQVLCGSAGVFKEPNRYGTWDGTTWTSQYENAGHTHWELQFDKMEPGTYAIWHIQANFLGNLSGRYRFVETIPAGMELAYVSYYWYGPRYNDSNRPYPVKAELGSDWEEHTVNNGGKICYYYTYGQQAIWEVDGLQAGHEIDGYGVEYQIACRVTDPDVLLGNETKVFTNYVSLINPETKKEAGDSSHPLEIGKTTLAKTGDYHPDVNEGRYPFIITLNPLGEDLSSAGDTITLVDELSDTLILDAASIKVINTATDEEVQGWTSSVDVDTNTFRLVLPDNQPLTITYETIVNAPPDQPVDFVNRAHWEGYASSNGTIVDEKNFEYTVGGTAGSSTPPSLEVIKEDQNNTSKHLPGAEFTLQEVEYGEDGAFTPVEGGAFWTGVTGEDGVLMFGNANDQIMKYNAIYCLTETGAPEGYVLDDTPRYIAVAQKVDGQYPQFPAGVTVWYSSPKMTCQVVNRRGEITVVKEFINARGSLCKPFSGTYTFGLYDNSEGEGDPVQTKQIVYSQSDLQAKSVVFKDLPLDKTYFVFELDDAGNPIRTRDAATIGGNQFLVAYSGPDQTTPNQAGEGQCVTVTNQSFTPELPQTGGIGTVPYTLGGLLMMVCAAGLLYSRKRAMRKDFR